MYWKIYVGTELYDIIHKDKTYDKQDALLMAKMLKEMNQDKLITVEEVKEIYRQ